MELRIVLGIVLSFVLMLPSSEARQTSPFGTWAAGYNHPTNSFPGWPSTFEAINMAVIPEAGTGGPSNPGKVIVWDKNDANTFLGTAVPWPQRFAVGAPETGVFNNYVVNIPAGFGDLFCAGHAWMPDGRLFVAGGTTQYQITGGPTFYIGSMVAAIWDPAQVSVGPYFGWTFLPPMQFERWYPTVTLLGNNQIMVAGGVVDTDSTQHNICLNPPSFDGAIDTYEIWDIATSSWAASVYNGPEHAYLGNCFSMFGEYPRQHLLSDGTLFVVGQWRGANHVHHPTNPGVWAQDPPNPALDTSEYRNYGASVLVSNVGRRAAAEDKVMIIGGSNYISTVLPDTVKSINGYSGTAWAVAPALNVSRMVANAVLLPDGAILEIGGCTGPDYFAYPASRTPEKRPEVYRKSVNAWVLQSPQLSERMYHSTAALLPSGNVVTAGSDVRSRDWEVFTPDYLSSGQTRPAFATSSLSNVSFGTVYSIQYVPMSPGLTVDRVVLMAPCSITHHSDMHQRYVELEEPAGTPPPNTIRVKMPPTPVPTGTTQGSVVAPPGWYMMFLVSNTGTPSIAQWVHLQ